MAGRPVEIYGREKKSYLKRGPPKPVIQAHFARLSKLLNRSFVLASLLRCAALVIQTKLVV